MANNNKATQWNNNNVNSNQWHGTDDAGDETASDRSCITRIKAGHVCFCSLEILDAGSGPPVWEPDRWVGLRRCALFS